MNDNWPPADFPLPRWCQPKPAPRPQYKLDSLKPGVGLWAHDQGASLDSRYRHRCDANKGVSRGHKHAL